LLKVLEDSLKKLSLDNLEETIITYKKELFEIVCRSAEQEDITIRAQAQQLLSFMLIFILDRELPLREELEILLVKVVLKPAVSLMKRLSKKASNAQQPDALSA
jgi:hypothetical protein